MKASEWAKQVKEEICEVQKIINKLSSTLSLKEYYLDEISEKEFDVLDDFEWLGIEMDYNLKYKAIKALNRIIENA